MSSDSKSFVDGVIYKSSRPEEFYEKVFWSFPQNWQETTCSVISAASSKRDSNTGAFMRILLNLSEYFFTQLLLVAASLNSCVLTVSNHDNVMTFVLHLQEYRKEPESLKPY